MVETELPAPLTPPSLHWPSSAARHSAIPAPSQVRSFISLLQPCSSAHRRRRRRFLLVGTDTYLAERRRFPPLHSRRSRALSFHARLPLPPSDHWLPWERVRSLSAVRRSDSTSSSPRRPGPLHSSPPLRLSSSPLLLAWTQRTAAHSSCLLRAFRLTFFPFYPWRLRGPLNKFLTLLELSCIVWIFQHKWNCVPWF